MIIEYLDKLAGSVIILTMQVTVYGASGRVGRIVVRLLLERGHEVVALVHSHNPFGEQTGLTVQAGDIYESTDVERALRGSQAVISTLGSWGTKRKDVVGSAAALIIPGMRAAGTKRIVTVTGIAALWAGDNPRLRDRAARLMLLLVAPKIVRDGERHLELLAASDLDWTTVRSPAMVKGQSSNYALRNKLSMGLYAIPREAVARAIVDQLDSQDFIGSAPVIYKR